MTPFQRAYIPESETNAILDDLWAKPESFWIELMGRKPSEAEMRQFIQGQVDKCRRVFKNDLYQVAIIDCEVGRGWPAMRHFSIKRIDRQPIRDWRHLQQIKNELGGPECEAVEIYPAESRLVDTANQFHLWVFVDPTIRLPFGFFPEQRMVSADSVGKSVNRAFAEM